MISLVKKTTILVIPAIVLLFLISCTSIRQQQIESKDALSSNNQGLAYVKKGGQGEIPPDSSKPPSMS
jgi:hypothetical protein